MARDREQPNKLLTVPMKNCRLSAATGLMFLVFGGAVLWVVLWGLNAATMLKGQNTAPVFVRAVEDIGNWRGTESELVGLNVVGVSAATGKNVPFEKLAGEKSTSACRWVLLSKIILQFPSIDPAAVPSIEYAYDADCRNEEQGLPSGLVWHSAKLHSESSNAHEVTLDVPRYANSFIPLKSVSGSINWGGDGRLLWKAIPSQQFPFFCFCAAGVVLLLISLMGAVCQHRKLSNSFTTWDNPVHTRRLHWSNVCFWGLVLAFVMAVVAGDPVYDVNDDHSIITMLAGYQSFPVDGRGLFINSGLGIFISKLYSLAPTVPWYGVCLLATLFGGVILALRAIIRHSPNPIFSMLATAAMLVCCCYLPFVRTTFSLGAELITVGAILSLASQFVIQARTSRTIAFRERLDIVLASAALLLGSLFRFQAFAMICALLIPCVICFVAALCPELTLRSIWNEERFLKFMLLGSVVIAWLFHGVDQHFDRRDFNGGPWHEAFDPIATVVDRSPEFNKAIAAGQFAKTGWTIKELELLDDSFLLEGKFRDSNELGKLVSVMKDASRDDTFSERIARTNRAFLSIWSPSESLCLITVFLLATGLCSFISTSRNVCCCVILVCLWALVLHVLVSLWTKPVPYRVGYGMMYAASAAAFLFLAAGLKDSEFIRRSNGNRPNQRFGNAFFYVVFPVLICVQLYLHVQAANGRHHRAESFRAEFAEITKLDEPYLMFHMPSQAQPVLSSTVQLKDDFAIPCGYIAATHSAQKARDLLGFRGLAASLDGGRPLTIVIGNASAQNSGLFEGYLSELCRTRIRVRVVLQGECFQILKAQRVPS